MEVGMLVLGISGGLDLIHETVFDLPVDGLSHDAAAVLIEDGEIVAAIEEERLTRIKHTNRFPLNAIAHCLRQRGATLGDIDFLSFYLNEDWLTSFFQKIFISSDLPYEAMTPAERATTIREKIADRVQSRFEIDITGKLRFVDHHVAHAMSTYAFSGRNESLIAVFDGAGETTAGLIAEARDGSLEKLHEISSANSLGGFYLSTIAYLGFKIFDEYKVMGLATRSDSAPCSKDSTR
jgi:carbamoyltransferase